MFQSYTAETNWLFFLQHRFPWAFPSSVTDVPSTGCPESLSCVQPLQPVMPQFCLLDLCLVLQCLPFSIVTERSARGRARMTPSTDGSLLWSARLLTVLPAADSCFRDENGIPLPPRCQRSRWLLIPDTTRSLLGLVQHLPSALSACWPRPVLHAGHCCPLTTYRSHPKAHLCLPL